MAISLLGNGADILFTIAKALMKGMKNRYRLLCRRRFDRNRAILSLLGRGFGLYKSITPAQPKPHPTGQERELAGFQKNVHRVSEQAILPFSSQSKSIGGCCGGCFFVLEKK
jgi:hypothetical protein